MQPKVANLKTKMYGNYFEFLIYFEHNHRTKGKKYDT